MTRHLRRAFAVGFLLLIPACGGDEAGDESVGAPPYATEPPPEQVLAAAVQRELDDQLSDGVIQYHAPATLRVGALGVVTARVGYQTAKEIVSAARASGTV